jgi:hypothetical protein
MKNISAILSATLTVCLTVAGIAALVAVLAFINTFTASLLWTWFITPQFGMLTPSFAALYGLMLCVGFVSSTHGKADEKRSTTDAISTLLAKNAVFLLFGYVVHLFV